MAGEVCKSIPAAQSLFDKAASILGYDLLDKVGQLSITIS